MHIVITNGPPFSGKDTFTEHFLSCFPNAVWMRYKNVLYKETWKDLFVSGENEEITLDEWIEICNDIKLKDMALPYNLSREEIMLWKESPDVWGNNIYCKTPRKHLIDKSEDDIKVKHGDGGVAVITAGYIREIKDWEKKLFVFSDGGFNVEIETLIQELGICRDDLTVIRLDAEGCNFNNDSREYIHHPDFTLFNDKTPKFKNDIDEIIIPAIRTRLLESKADTMENIVQYTFDYYLANKERLKDTDDKICFHNETYDEEWELFDIESFKSPHDIIEKLKNGYSRFKFVNDGDVQVSVKYNPVYENYTLLVKPEPSEQWKWRRVLPV